MSRRRSSRDEVRGDDLNMTPMIDVTFQLLIFFMLSMHFREVEGKLLSQLPRDKGVAPANVIPQELREVRIVLCAGGDLEAHLQDRAGHDTAAKPDGVCRVLVGQAQIGDLYKTETDPSKAAANKAAYQALGRKTSELYQALPTSRGRDSSQRPSVVLDADREVPYEHIIGVVNACRAVGIDNVEFMAGPRLEKYYAPRKGPK